MNKKSLGQFGEDMSAEYLNSQNYKILTTNYHCRYGEIDIVALHQNTLVFIEVKTRTTETFGQLQETITHTKRQRLLKTALHFLQNNPQIKSKSWRIDLIGLKLSSQDQRHKLENLIHIKNILDA